MLDALQEMLIICKERFQNGSISLVTSYFNEYEFPENHYDLIVSGFSIHHCNSEEKKNIFKKIYHSLKKEGIYASSDLMISKNQPEHTELINFWKEFVFKSYPNKEKWQWLMEHYDEFDKPDSLNNQLRWLQEIGLKILISLLETTIGCILKQ